jgi:hypothetical protein
MLLYLSSASLRSFCIANSMDTICEVDDFLRILSLTGGRSECKAMQLSPKPTRPFPFIEVTDFAGDKKQASLH